MKHKKRLPLLELPQGSGHPPAGAKRIFELWMVDVAVKMGTWGPDAPHQWMNIVEHARQNDNRWLEWSAEQRVAVESSYCYGDQLPFPPSGTVLESHLRIELMD
eukprot:5852431-Prorocentrum_lima.AAC.1